MKRRGQQRGPYSQNINREDKARDIEHMGHVTD